LINLKIGVNIFHPPANHLLPPVICNGLSRRPSRFPEPSGQGTPNEGGWQARGVSIATAAAAIRPSGLARHGLVFQIGHASAT
jgi:hypothetical protein